MKTSKKFQVQPDTDIKLKQWDPADKAGLSDKQSAAVRVAENVQRIADLQYKLFAENKQALLVVFQATDTGGKDGTIRKVFSGVNPQGVRVTPFGKPSEMELEHDYLWRIHKACPAKGMIGIFNRSHYEDVLVVRVHNLVPKSVWSKRYDQINAFEKHLSANGTRIIKFYLNIDKEEQRERLQARLEDPSKNWKFNVGDLAERKKWTVYQRAFEAVLSKCSTKEAPWFVVPANRKWVRNVVISDIIRETLESMNPKTPPCSDDLANIVVE